MPVQQHAYAASPQPGSVSDRVRFPPVTRLRSKLQNPTRHRDKNPDHGQTRSRASRSFWETTKPQGRLQQTHHRLPEEILLLPPQPPPPSPRTGLRPHSSRPWTPPPASAQDSCPLNTSLPQPVPQRRHRCPPHAWGNGVSFSRPREPDPLRLARSYRAGFVLGIRTSWWFGQHAPTTAPDTGQTLLGDR